MADKYDNFRPHKLCLWEPGTQNRFREESFQDAVEIDGRWFEGRHEYVGSDGKSQTASHSAFVDREIPLGSYIRKGPLSDIDPEASPHDYAGVRPSNAHPVVDFSTVWDFEDVPFRSVSMT